MTLKTSTVLILRRLRRTPYTSHCFASSEISSASTWIRSSCLRATFTGPSNACDLKSGSIWKKSSYPRSLWRPSTMLWYLWYCSLQLQINKKEKSASSQSFSRNFLWYEFPVSIFLKRITSKSAAPFSTNLLSSSYGASLLRSGQKSRSITWGACAVIPWTVSIVTKW